MADESYNGKAELERFLDLMSISDDRLRIMNSNERLGRINYDKRILNRTMSEEEYKKSWLYLDNLADEYHDLVQRGIAKNRKTKYLRQLEIEAETAERMTPYVWKIATAMVYGNGWIINTRHGYKVRLNLKDSEIPLEDLVQEGLTAIVDKLCGHDPEKGGVATYFRTVVAAEMYKQGRRYTGLLQLPQNVFNEARTALGRNDNKSLKKLLEDAASETPGSMPKSLQGIAIYYGLKRKWVDIHGPSGGKEDSPSHDHFEGRYLEDETDENKIEELVGDKQLQQKAVALLKILTPREQDIIQKRIWEGKTLQKVGDEYGLSRERIRNLEARALGKLRNAILI